MDQRNLLFHYSGNVQLSDIKIISLLFVDRAILGLDIIRTLDQNKNVYIYYILTTYLSRNMSTKRKSPVRAWDSSSSFSWIRLRVTPAQPILVA